MEILAWTAETLWPAQGEQIVAASLLARKVRLEFELVARVILHQALHYILGSPESSGYQAYLIGERGRERTQNKSAGGQPKDGPQRCEWEIGDKDRTVRLYGDVERIA